MCSFYLYCLIGLKSSYLHNTKNTLIHQVFGAGFYRASQSLIQSFLFFSYRSLRLRKILGYASRKQNSSASEHFHSENEGEQKPPTFYFILYVDTFYSRVRRTVGVIF
jgi:hypothetical protein